MRDGGGEVGDGRGGWAVAGWGWVWQEGKGYERAELGFGTERWVRERWDLAQVGLSGGNEVDRLCKFRRLGLALKGWALALVGSSSGNHVDRL